MTRYAMQLVLDKWITPHIDIDKWEFYDLSCKSRDDTEDQVLKDAVEAGKRLKSIFKEPTITPTEVQVKEMGLSKGWGSPNGMMRRGWNGITISRDTIHIEGVELGYRRPVFFERHAVGGEYGAGWKPLTKGKLITQFFPSEGGAEATLGRTDFTIVDQRDLKDNDSVAVVYHNPLDNVEDLAHHFFSRCLAADIVPYVVTKKTVFKWQEAFWSKMKKVFDDHYRTQFLEKGLLEKCGGELQHLISDAATMQIIRWNDGGFGMAAHNYDGDMLTDEVAQVHRSPGFITSNLIGKTDSGELIKEFEASHGTVADLWNLHQKGEETSFNPLGMVEAIIGAMDHSASFAGGETEIDVHNFTKLLRKAVHTSFRAGEGTRDMCGPAGLTTEDFVDVVAKRLKRYLAGDFSEKVTGAATPKRKNDPTYDVDTEAVRQMFDKYDKNGDGTIDIEEFESMVVKLGVAPHLKSKEKTDNEAGQV
eukprot:TRINITY_DN419_c1_g2_i1.p1 TRINITY_DN419_c1_g2~~TRINITY_DN419_c1_g2_i1.p1  ORF type:complete len:533 (+),score=151.79 TRINITY_DN419_c1_g2_i1:172-1599(+)